MVSALVEQSVGSIAGDGEGDVSRGRAVVGNAIVVSAGAAETRGGFDVAQ